MGYLYPDLSKVSDYSDFEVSNKDFYKKTTQELSRDQKMKSILGTAKNRSTKLIGK